MGVVRASRFPTISTKKPFWHYNLGGGHLTCVLTHCYAHVMSVFKCFEPVSKLRRIVLAMFFTQLDTSEPTVVQVATLTEFISAHSEHWVSWGACLSTGMTESLSAHSGSWGSWGAWLSTVVICWSHWVAPLASEWGHCRDSPFRGVSITNYSKSCLHNTYIPL